MEHILDIIMIPIQVIIVFYSLYYFILACFGLMKRRERITVAPKNTFAAVICAHNEEKSRLAAHRQPEAAQLS